MNYANADEKVSRINRSELEFYIQKINSNKKLFIHCAKLIRRKLI